MPNDAPAGTLTPPVTAALEELRERLKRPETVRLALKQYVVSEIVRAIVDANEGVSLTTTSQETSNTKNDDGTATVCHTDSYVVLGVTVYQHQVCEQVAATGTGSATVTVSE